MNAQERYEKFVLPDDVAKVSVVSDTKIANAVSITVEREDHTVGNLLRHQLHRDPAISFVGYKVEHPLEHKVKFQIKSKEGAEPVQCFVNALQDLENEVGEILEQFCDKLGEDVPE